MSQLPLIVDRGHPMGYGMGLIMQTARDVYCSRHYSCDKRAEGIWEVWASPSVFAADVIGCYSFTRPAVVDDFGSLVFVGEPQ